MGTSSQRPLRLGRVAALDGLRAVGVLLVVELHVGLVAGGYIGVDVFLPLSGFLITALLCEEWEREGDIRLARFMARRARRLVPALVLLVGLFTLVMATLHPWGQSWPLGRLAASTLLFANNWVASFEPHHGAVLGALSPTWTLAQEGQFYLLWPPVLGALLAMRARPRALLAVLAALIVGLLLTAPLLGHLGSAYNTYTSPFNRGAELLFGCAAAIVWRERMLPRSIGSPAIGWLLAAAIAYLVYACRVASPTVYLAAAALSALLLVNLLTPSRSRVPGIGRILESPPLRFTGRISYAIYLFHVPIYYLVWTYVGFDSRYWYGITTPLLSIAFAWISWKLVEQPAMRFTRRSRRPVRATRI
ncbi:MAG TPA: acyltransferase, partial [Solirubrobacteraceae bacterium]